MKLSYRSLFSRLAASGWCALGLVAAPVAARAASQTVLSYTFDGLSGTPSSVATGVSGSEFVRDGSTFTFYDNSAGNPAPDTNSSGWATSATLNLSLYDTFTITPAPGGTAWNLLSLDLANFDGAGINDGPTRFAVRSSLDNFGSNLLTGVVGTGFASYSTALSVTASAPVEYRIYGFGAGSDGGLLQVDNVALSFNTVPEPSAAATLCAGGLLLGLFVFRRVRASVRHAA